MSYFDPIKRDINRFMLQTFGPKQITSEVHLERWTMLEPGDPDSLLRFVASRQWSGKYVIETRLGSFTEDANGKKTLSERVLAKFPEQLDVRAAADKLTALGDAAFNQGWTPYSTEPWSNLPKVREAFNVRRTGYTPLQLGRVAFMLPAAG